MPTSDELRARILALREALSAHPGLLKYLSTVSDVLAALDAPGGMAEPSETPPADFADPDWAAAGRIHEWKNYVSDPLQQEWPTLPLRVRALIATGAQGLADNEEWD